MTKTQYYEEMKILARQKRQTHTVVTAKLDLPKLHRIYKEERIRIDRRPIRGNRLRGAYMCADGDCSVLLKRDLPREPKIFTLAHELKHHYVDQELIEHGEIQCGDYNAQEVIEKAAEVFAAEFIYPELEMQELIAALALPKEAFSPETVVRFKRECIAPISYTFLVKRFERFGYCTRGEYAKIHFVKLEESIYGVPFYKKPAFQRSRAMRSRQR